MFTKIYYKTKEILRFIINIFKYIITFFISFIFVFFLQDIFKFNDDIGFSLALVLSISLFILLLKKENKSPIEYLKIHKITLKNTLSLILFAFILVGFKLTIANILIKYIPNNITSETQLYFWSILSLVVVAPICEEICFRGILFQKLTELMPSFLSIIIQSFIFGIIHGAFSGHIIQSITSGLSGVVYALIYKYKNNLTDSILLHSFHNSILVILNLLFPNF